LLLNSDGHKALLDRSLDRRNPPNELLAAPGAPIAAVYIWCVVAKNRMALLQASMLKHAGHLFGVPRYATLATEDSMKFGAGAGFEPVSPADAQKGGLFRLPAALPILKRVDSAALTVKVVETASELDQAKAVRVATFVSEQKCPFGEEFDGNDYSAQHLVGYVDGEPAATMRIRYFAGFAKWERYCVRDSFRKTGIKDSLIAYAIDLVSRKGYTRIYFQAEPSLKVFWGRRGFSVSSRPGRIQFSDREYQEFEMHVAPHQKAITLADNPMMLNRVEGQWDCAGVLDRSQRRLQRAAA
jgi:predicted GNAT family N-acyltransferase